LPAKLMIQEAWSNKAEWDAPLPEKIQKDFRTWYGELKYLSELKIPRQVGLGDKKRWSIHVFCDASQKAYATVIYLRSQKEDKVLVQLLGAKCRIAPKKKITIPRLELLACVLGARLANFILKALSISFIPIRYWSDSSTVLAWILRNDQWGTFVGNRIKEICNLTEPQQWSFVPGHLNPADLPSRGCSPQHLVKTRWWEGPDWLRLTEEQWPRFETTPNEDLVMLESRKTAAISLPCTKVSPFMNYERISGFSKIINVICWVKRFILKCKNRNCTFANSLQPEEKQEAEKVLWTLIQREHFADVKDRVDRLLVVKDEYGILRVKTKILDRDDEFDF
ncbi:integrase core domain protein, partial [Lasius niger]